MLPLFRSCCWHQINIRLMPILLSFYYGHLFVRTHSRSELLNSPTSAPSCAPLSFAPIPSMGDSHITLQQRQNESSSSNGKYNCAGKLVTELINWLGLIGFTPGPPWLSNQYAAGRINRKTRTPQARNAHVLFSEITVKIQAKKTISHQAISSRRNPFEFFSLSHR